jgi:CRP/FNR family transcriptional regulator, dissimilatory nitrate respiration regulator
VLAEPQLAFDMLAVASMQLRQLLDENEQLKTLRFATHRRFLRQAAYAASGAVRIALPFEKAPNASRLGMKPESFSRALGKLAELGVVVERYSVIIPDVERLAAFADA